LVRQALRIDDQTLVVGNANVAKNIGDADGKKNTEVCRLRLDAIRRLAVVGAGKAGAGMAEAVEEVLGPQLMAEKELTGWVNVPADCVRPLSRIHLHAARPAGINEPRPEGVAGTEAILKLVASLGPEDLCLCLISGGGSALLPAPANGITLADKLAVTQHLSGAGATIEELNTVRSQLSRIKGGGLLRACRAGRVIALIISDVLGDPLDMIASGSTVPGRGHPGTALRVLERFATRNAEVAPAVFTYLEKAAARYDAESGHSVKHLDVANILIGNNAAAVAAAAEEAERLGYNTARESALQSEGLAEEVGRRLAAEARAMRDGDGRRCLVSGGEPVVKLVDSARRGLGGRNQQLVLAALADLADDGARRMALLSGGTDGEDGPTDAAGAFLDGVLLAAARRSSLDPVDYLARNDAYRFFAPLGGLIRTGPTHTNVCDLRIVLTESGG
jgi:hydroxypyruvate reductase